MISAAVRAPAHLLNPQATPLTAKLRRELLHLDHAVRQTLELPVDLGRGLVAEQDDRRAAIHEDLLEHQQLTTKRQGIAGEQRELRERVEDHPLRLDALDLLDDRA